jgi:hypothetical protein
VYRSVDYFIGGLTIIGSIHDPTHTSIAGARSFGCMIKGGLRALGHSTPKSNIPSTSSNFLSGVCYIAAIVVLLLFIFGIEYVPGRQGFMESIGGGLILLAIIAFGGRPGSRAKFHALQAVLLMCATIIIIQLTVYPILTQPITHDSVNLGSFITGLQAIIVYGFWVLLYIVFSLRFGCKAGDGRDPQLFIIGDLAAKIARYAPPGS